MPDLLATGTGWLAGQLKQFAGRSVSYLRRHERHELTATHVAQEYTVIQQDGLSTVVRLDDFLFTAADLPFEPRSGDRIEEAGQLFEVTPLGDSPCWELQDSSGILAVVHTKRIKHA